GDFVHRQSEKVVQLDQLDCLGVDLHEVVQRLVHRDQIGVSYFYRQRDSVQCDPLQLAAVSNAVFTTGVLDQNASHSLGSSGKAAREGTPTRRETLSSH